MAVLALGGSFALRPGPAEGALVLPVPLSGGRTVTLPPLCPLKVNTGHDCPGCGLTRSFVAIAHGRPAEGFAIHRVGLALFLMAVYQLWYRPWMIRRDEILPPEPLRRVHVWIGRGLIAALIASWLWNVLSPHA